MPIDKQLPAYKSHKTVWALKIRAIVPNPEGGFTITPNNPNFDPFTVSNDYWTKHNPHPGGYWVLYQDGYQSFSPAKAFEDGNTLVDLREKPAMAESKEETHFLQPKITGYRQLSEAEVALMNEGKALAAACGDYVAKLRGYTPENTAGVKPGSTLDQRWISIGATDLQTGFMAVIRGIAQPTTF